MITFLQPSDVYYIWKCPWFIVPLYWYVIAGHGGGDYMRSRWDWLKSMLNLLALVGKSYKMGEYEINTSEGIYIETEPSRFLIWDEIPWKS